MPANRFARAAVRLALRQQARLAEHLRDAALGQIVAGRQRVHDQGADAEDDDAPGH